MAKRIAVTDLNQDNWDEEEKPEERGTFKTVSEEELKKRIIKNARRNLPAASDDAGASKGLTGFGNITTNGATPSAALSSFLTNLIPRAATSYKSGVTTNFTHISNTATKETKIDKTPSKICSAAAVVQAHHEKPSYH